MYIIYIQMFKIYTVCVCIYIHNKYTQYTHTLCKQKLLFWIRLNILQKKINNIYIYTIDIVFLYFIIMNFVFGSENNGGPSTNWNYRYNWSLLLTTASILADWPFTLLQKVYFSNFYLHYWLITSMPVKMMMHLSCVFASACNSAMCFFPCSRFYRPKECELIYDSFMCWMHIFCTCAHERAPFLPFSDAQIET